MVVQIDHYGVLGLGSGVGVSKEEIKQAYRSKLLTVHDDRDEFLKLLHSYQVLKDPKSRKLFDDHLRIQRVREEKNDATLTKRRRMISRSAASSSLVKEEEDIIDVESISKVTKEDDTTKRKRMMSNSFVKEEEDVIDVESISKITAKQDDATKRQRMMSRSAASSSSSFVKKEEGKIDAESISEIAAKKEDNDSKRRSGKQEDDEELMLEKYLIDTKESINKELRLMRVENPEIDVAYDIEIDLQKMKDYYLQMGGLEWLKNELRTLKESDVFSFKY